MGFILLFQSLSKQRFSWVMLLILGIILEGCGLYFQYELRLQPCVSCVYERAFYLSFIVAGFLGFLGPRNIIFRILAILIFLGGSIGGLIISFDHLASAYQTGLSASCKLSADFPSYLPLDKWLPWMFTPTASCGPVDWQLLGFSMPAWICFSFTCGTIVSSLFLISQFIKRKQRDFIKYYR